MIKNYTTYPIDKWLADHHAVLLFRTPVTGSQQSVIECYSTNGRTFLVMRHAVGAWDVYIPVAETNETPATLDALTLYVQNTDRTRYFGKVI